MRLLRGMQRLKRDLFLVILCVTGLLEAAYLLRYGIHWLMAALGTTAFLASLWMRRHWDA